METNRQAELHLTRFWLSDLQDRTRFETTSSTKHKAVICGAGPILDAEQALERHQKIRAWLDSKDLK